jgi:glycosidase
MFDSKDELIKMLRNYNQFGFQLSRKSWDLLELSAVANADTDESPKTDIYILRRLSEHINVKRAQIQQIPEPMQAGKLVTLSVLVDVFRYIVGLYCQKEHPGTISRAMEWAASQQGLSVVSKPPQSFARLFPPTKVLQGKQPENEFQQSIKLDQAKKDSLIGEMVLLHFSCLNPAFKPYKILFDDSDLKNESPFIPLMQSLESYFATQPPLSILGLTLFECLYAPIRACSGSLECQLDYIRQHWGGFLPLELLEQLYLASDILVEERSARTLDPGPSEVLRFDRGAYGFDLGYSEPAAFSRDADWMSNVVLIAKTVYVWLFQLSQKYQRDIRLLSDIPDEELDQLARWGFTGLWLIGVWERSSASKKIKQIMGNPEAASSAYSLYDYVIAADLGGEEALQNLKWRAWQRGIRLTSDMVPNHMGIYSRWVIEHPHWFIQSSHTPFPVYQYTGIDLSEDDRVCIQIEDGYWQHRDAAVVFKRIDKYTGDVRYIYHGNDGTSMPWNDTAQLNFLLPEVREAVIQTILHVARKFPIIRFDAAMTLAKRHYQRLWFPKPGEGGAIPSRAECGMTKAEFDALIPIEFWREVVDRVTHELPETLLLAEAFWLMEGYFVRTLGMHRVYNSAFMNMLKMEENFKYRTTLKNVLEFSPQVLQRFVNFMNNPDERTAVEQFGRGDKYYGVAMMMVTMPGLPMFGHGQIEGFSEKYGMEYQRSYWDEKVDMDMIHRHEAQIFPIMRKRHIFSGAAHFALYDYITREGHVDENVFAYSNKAGHDRALILYNNAYNSTAGNIRLSTAINISDADNAVLIRRTVAEALELNAADNCYYIFRDYQNGLEYIRPANRIAADGLFFELGGYQFHAFLDWREIVDNDGSWRELEQKLGGSGLASIEEAHRELIFRPILIPFRDFINKTVMVEFQNGEPDSKRKAVESARNFYESVIRFIGSSANIDTIVNQFEQKLDWLATNIPQIASEKNKTVDNKEQSQISNCELSYILFAKSAVDLLSKIRSENDRTEPAILMANRFHQWFLLKTIQEAFGNILENGHAAYWDSRLLSILVSHPDSLVAPDKALLSQTIRKLFIDSDVRDYLEIHTYENVLWLNKERLERLMESIIWGIELDNDTKPVSDTVLPKIVRSNARLLLDMASASGYQVEKMLNALNELKPEDDPAAKERLTP